MSISLFELEPDALRKYGLLDREAVDRILAAPAIPLCIGEKLKGANGCWKVNPATQMDLIRLTLMSIAYGVVQLAMRTRRVPIKERRAAEKAYLTMIRAFDRLRLSDAEAPEPPAAWRADVEEWLGIIQSPNVTGSGGRLHIATKPMTPLLLGFFVAAYEVEPGTGEAGPANRFLEAFYQELHLSATIAVKAGRIDESVNYSAFVKTFVPPTPAAVREWLQAARDGGRILEFTSLVVDLAQAIAPKMTSRAG